MQRSSSQPTFPQAALAELQRELDQQDAEWLALLEATQAEGAVPPDTEVHVRQDFLDELETLTTTPSPTTKRWAGQAEVRG